MKRKKPTDKQWENLLAAAQVIYDWDSDSLMYPGYYHRGYIKDVRNLGKAIAAIRQDRSSSRDRGEKK